MQIVQSMFMDVFNASAPIKQHCKQQVCCKHPVQTTTQQGQHVTQCPAYQGGFKGWPVQDLVIPGPAVQFAGLSST